MAAMWLGKLLRPAVDARPDHARLLGAGKKHSSSTRHRRVGPTSQRVSTAETTTVPPVGTRHVGLGLCGDRGQTGQNGVEAAQVGSSSPFLFIFYFPFLFSFILSYFEFKFEF